MARSRDLVFLVPALSLVYLFLLGLPANAYSGIFHESQLALYLSTSTSQYQRMILINASSAFTFNNTNPCSYASANGYAIRSLETQQIQQSNSVQVYHCPLQLSKNTETIRRSFPKRQANDVLEATNTTNSSSNSSVSFNEDASYNWAGWVSLPGAGMANSVTGSWIVLNAMPWSESGTMTAQWIGIGGVDENTLIQEGTDVSFSGGTSTTSAWYELLPEASVTISGMTVSGGDHMYSNITLIATNTYKMTLIDLTRDESNTMTVTYNGMRSSVEWVTETPEVCDPSCVITAPVEFGSSYDGNDYAASSNSADYANIIGYGFQRISNLPSLTQYYVISEGSDAMEMQPSSLNPSGTSFTVNSFPHLLNLTPSNTILDSGQYVTFNVFIWGGTGPYTSNLVASNDLVFNSIASGTNGTIKFKAGQLSTGTYTYNVVSEDSAQVPETFNSIQNTIIVNPQFSQTAWTPSNSALDTNKYQSLVIAYTGGTSPFTINAYVYNAIGSIVYNSIYRIAGDTSNTFTFQITPSMSTGTYSANVYITDSASSPETVANVLTFMVNGNFLSTSFTSSNNQIDQDGYQTLSSTVSGGTAPYTYNFIIYNSIGQVANAIFLSSSTTNTFSFQANPLWGTGIFTANFLGNDTFDEETMNILTFTINNNLRSTTFSASNDIIDSGQNELLTSQVSGGTSPYTYNFLIYNSIGLLVANQLTSDTGQTSNTFSFQINPIWLAGTFTANILLYDSASPNEITSNSLTFYVLNGLTFLSQSSSNSLIDQGQYQMISVSTFDGISPYTYNFVVYNSVGVVANALFGNVVSASNAFIFMQNSSWEAGAFTVNVLITDSSSRMVSNTLFYGANAPVNAGPISPSNPSISSGQSVTLTSNATGGTNPISYQWYTSSEMAACVPGDAISNATSDNYSASPGSTSTYVYQATDTATTPNTSCSTVDTVTVQTSEGGSGGGGGGGGVSSAGGGGSGGTFKPTVLYLNSSCYKVLNMTPPGYTIVNFTSASFFIRTNFVSPTSAGLTIDNTTSYNLSLGNPVSISKTADYNYSMEMYNISYLPVLHTITIDVCGGSASGNTVKNAVKAINISSENYTAIVNISNEAPIVIYIDALKTSLNITSPISSEQVVSIKNETSYTGFPTLPLGYNLLLAENISLQMPANSSTRGNISIIAHIGYNCTLSPDNVALFVLANDSWEKEPPSANTGQGCYVAFGFTSDPILAIAAYEPLNASTTTIPQSTATTAVSTVPQISSVPQSPTSIASISSNNTNNKSILNTPQLKLAIVLLIAGLLIFCILKLRRRKLRSAQVYIEKLNPNDIPVMRDKVRKAPGR